MKRWFQSQLQSLRSGLLLAESVQTAAEAAVRASESAGLAAEAAGSTGSFRLASEFEVFYQRLRTAGWYWLATTFAIATVSLVLAIVHLGNVSNLDWQEIARKASVGVPLLALLVVTTHEARINREHALWIGHVVAQLQSFPAFVDPLADGEKESLRVNFAAIIFAGPPAFEFATRRSSSRQSARELRTLEALLPLVQGAAKH